MCDFSLQSVRSRPAQVGDKLVTRDFGTGTRGFSASDDPGMAVCILPGTELAFTGDIAYHDYEGIALDLDERDRLVADIGKEKHAMILRNHGTLTLGRSCPYAFMRMYYLERACTMQIKALSGGMKWYKVNQGVEEKTAGQGKMAFEGVLGALAWPALLRKLDRIDPSSRH